MVSGIYGDAGALPGQAVRNSACRAARPDNSASGARQGSDSFQRFHCTRDVGIETMQLTIPNNDRVDRADRPGNVLQFISECENRVRIRTVYAESCKRPIHLAAARMG